MDDRHDALLNEAVRLEAIVTDSVVEPSRSRTMSSAARAHNILLRDDRTTRTCS